MLPVGLPVLLPWSLDTLPVTASFILTGYALRKFLQRERTIKELALVFIVSALLMRVVNEVNGEANLSVREYGDLGVWSVPLYYISGVLFFTCLASLMRLAGRMKVISCLARIGRFSLTLMCLHLPLSPLMLPFTHYLSPLSSATVYILLLILLCIPLERLYKRLAPRCPLLGYLAT